MDPIPWRFLGIYKKTSLTNRNLPSTISTHEHASESPGRSERGSEKRVGSADCRGSEASWVEAGGAREAAGGATGAARFLGEGAEGSPHGGSGLAERGAGDPLRAG